MAITIPEKYYETYKAALPIMREAATDPVTRQFDQKLYDILQGIAYTESRFNPDAVSPAGAKGLMQFMPGTAAFWKVNPNDIASSIHGSAKYMRHLLKLFNGNYEHAIRAYNWGEGNMKAYLKTGLGLNKKAMPLEAQQYPGKVFQAAGMEYKPSPMDTSTAPSSGSSNAQPTTAPTVTTTVAPGSAYYPGSMPTYLGHGYAPARMFNQSNDGAMALAWNMLGQYAPHLQPFIQYSMRG